VNDDIAVITLDSTQQTIKKIEISQKQFHFKCKRCATLCCKLGGPALTRKDVEKIEQIGYNIEAFLEPTNNETTHSVGTMKSRKDGSCIFLKYDIQQKKYGCSIYAARPALCRIYPFKIEKLDPNRFALKIIPCCRGLNNPEGKPLDRNFVVNKLFEPMVEATKLL
jgi:Fe-S-cluster containining protein